MNEAATSVSTIMSGGVESRHANYSASDQIAGPSSADELRGVSGSSVPPAQSLARDGAGISQPNHTRLSSGSIPARATRYNRIGQLMIRPLVLRGEHSAFDLARLFYAQYANLNFEDDLVDFMRNGFVVTRPQLFILFKAIFYEGERIWFIRLLVGNLLEGISTMPFLLPKMAFCRNNHADKMVVVDTQRLIQLAKITAPNEVAKQQVDMLYVSKAL